MTQLTADEKALVESYCRDLKDTSPEYTCESRLFDQIVFIAPLFRMSENQTMGAEETTPISSRRSPARL